jgi:hypothetical protein
MYLDSFCSDCDMHSFLYLLIDFIVCIRNLFVVYCLYYVSVLYCFSVCAVSYLYYLTTDYLT